MIRVVIMVVIYKGGGCIIIMLMEDGEIEGGRKVGWGLIMGRLIERREGRNEGDLGIVLF